MSKLGQVVESVEKYNKFVLDQVKRARTDQKFGRDLLGRWNDTKAKIPVTRTPTGLPLPRLALPEIDEPGEIARYHFRRRFAGRIPLSQRAYREMYLEPVRETGEFRKERQQNRQARLPPRPEEPTRLFAGLGLAEDTNERFHYLTQHQHASAQHRLRRADALRARQRRRRRLRQDRRRRRGDRHRRRHGAALRWLRSADRRTSPSQ